MKRILLFLFISSIMAVSCQVKFVPTKSQTALDMVQKVQVYANAAFYDNPYNEGVYSVGNDAIDSLISFDKSRAKSGTILSQDNAIKAMFTTFQKEHKAKGAIVKSEQDTYKSYFKSVIAPRVISENSLK